MAESGAPRAWRATCSFCGAPVEFRSAASPMAVCSYCRSTLVRDGDTLRRIGQSAELFDDHSPLGLGVRGSFMGESFTLVGRLQYAYRDEDAQEGRWSSWHALFDNGRSAALSEDNGAYVLSWPQAQPEGALPDLSQARVGANVSILGRGWTLSSVVQAHVHAMEGEWPFMADVAQPFSVWELRNAQDEVLSIEALSTPPQLDVGRTVRLADLRLSGLPHRDEGKANVKAKGLACPSCGSSLTPTLDSTKTIVCGQCKAVVDVSKGLGADLAFYKQDNSLEPLIALGSRGALSVGGPPVTWQVVGYQERHNVPASPEDEAWFWREYLLYEAKEGFAFLVDAQDGWSLVQPVTGAPRPLRDQVQWQGTTYRQKEGSYTALTSYVLGEFYWPVRKGQRTLNTDYVGTGGQAQRVLNREMAGHEVTWSQGQTLSAEAVIQTFNVDIAHKRLFKRDASPLSTSFDWSGTSVALIVMVCIVLLILLMGSCEERCGRVRDTYGEASLEYQQCRSSSGSGGSGGWHGGSWGGYNSGGSHK
jgi:hypothetical protein